MESLLSLSFDNISSRDIVKIRKGLRQIESLLAQICLSNSDSEDGVGSPGLSSPLKRRASAAPALGYQQAHRKSQSVDTTSPAATPKLLRGLRHDPAFREFFRLQEGFQWNVASRLVQGLESLMGMGPYDSDSPTIHNHNVASQTDLSILSSLDLLQGALLLHPPSRSLFSRQSAMNLLLDLLDPSNPAAIQSHALLVLVTALLEQPRNIRTFEATDGLLTVTSLFKNRATSRDVRMRALEFLYFYLMPETPSSVDSSSSSSSGKGQRSRTQSPSHANGAMDVNGGEPVTVHSAEPPLHTRSTQEKQRRLGKYLANVNELVQDLQENGGPLTGTPIAT